jgi:hypothetical protein
MANLNTGYIFRCDKTWFDIPEFNELVFKWWLEFQLSGDIGTSWHEKMKFMRRKIRGRCKNFLGKKRKLKQNLLSTIQKLEKIKDYRDFINEEATMWLETKSQLDDIYLEEEKYWHERSRDQWLKDGDNNTSYFHRVTSNKKKKILILNLEIEGQMSDSIPQIEQHIIDFYKHLFGERNVQQAFLYDNF